MKISGFTFVRNAVRLDYPVVESIRSILPIVDEFVVNVGNSDDDTLGLIRSIGDSRIRIVESHWNPNVSTGGYVLAQQTNIALFNCTGTWAIYLQADEAIHERDHAWLRAMMAKYAADDRVEGLLLRRLTFLGDYKTISDVRPFHFDLSCRVVKPHRFVLSRGDAAGFTVHPKFKERGRRIRTVDTGLDFFHYADIRAMPRSVDFRGEKSNFWDQRSYAPDYLAGLADYYRKLPRSFVATYQGAHPSSMHDRIAQHQGSLDPDRADWRTKLTFRERRALLLTWLERKYARLPVPGMMRKNRIVASHRGEAGAAAHHVD
jgi:glycosyltransferase involved in cell wall biosynthesis